MFLRTVFESFRTLGEKKKYIFDNPGIEAEIEFWLRENRSIKLIGIDFISLLSFAHREEGRGAHKAFLCPYGKGGIAFDPILIIEDMKLAQYEENLKNIVVMPLRTKNRDGAPVTVVAW